MTNIHLQLKLSFYSVYFILDNLNETRKETWHLVEVFLCGMYTPAAAVQGEAALKSLS